MSQETAREMLQRYLKQPSTYVPIVAIVGYITHQNVPPEIRDAVTVIAAAIISVLIGFINERRGANPNNAPLPPAGTAPVVAPATSEVKAVALQEQPPNATEVTGK